MHSTPQTCRRYSRLGLLAILSFGVIAFGARAEPISLANVAIVVDAREPSYIRYGAEDLGSYLTTLTGRNVRIGAPGRTPRGTNVSIAIGERAAIALGAQAAPVDKVAQAGFVIRSFKRAETTVVAVYGAHAQGTNAGLARLLQSIRTDAGSAHLEGPLEVQSAPNYAVRGLHLNGWPLKYPYAFRSWTEQDWKRWIDIAWAQRINLVYIWPFMEIIPVPLSAADREYLQEVRRVIDYAQTKRGMQVWIMQSANRVAVSDCGTKDPRMRTYWVPGECQQDMNPGDPQQFARILRHFEAFYRIVDNAEGYCMIDSDPGGWPGSPLSDQSRIFNGARELLDRISVHRRDTKLIDWMWLGWGRDHTGSESGKQGVEHMRATIRNFKATLREPWELISGLSPYLESAQSESSLGKTVFLQYGAIENEPAFPATNLGQESIHDVFDTAARYPGLEGVMGNNELVLLQFPRTFNFFGIAWDAEYRQRSEVEVLRDLARQLHPDHQEELTNAFLALREPESQKVAAALAGLTKMSATGDAGRPGALGRFLFPTPLAIVNNLRLQLEIRLARQLFVEKMTGPADLEESSRLLESYFDKLLAWNEETGWSKMIDITIWRTPIYEEGADLSAAMAGLKKVLRQGQPYMTYAQADAFFARIGANLLEKHGRDSVMIGCIDPFKLALIQGW